MATDDQTERNPSPPTAELCGILLASLTMLADTGEPEAACRLAGRACAALRESDRAQWRRFNALLHRLSPQSPPVGKPAPHRPSGTRSSALPKQKGHGS